MQQRPVILTIALVGALVLAGCTTRETLHQAGSSTLLPLADRWAGDFGPANDVQVIVAGGGSGAGATKLCNSEIDLADMSRAMKQSEKDTCRAQGVEPVEWTVAFDGLSVVVSDQNTFVQDLTIDELAHLFGSVDPARRWNEVRAGFPANEVALCYPDADSGTYEYFGEAVLGEEAPRSGSKVQQSPNDNDLVKCIQSNPDAIGYFGYAYLLRNEDTLRAVSVDGVTPSPQTIADGTYSPLSRPLFIYTDGVPANDTALHRYLEYVLHDGQGVIEDVGYVALDQDTLSRMRDQLSVSMGNR